MKCLGTVTTCAECDKVFKGSYNQCYYNRKGRDVFCSEKCRFKNRSKIFKGKGNAFYGKTHNAATRSKISEANYIRGWSYHKGYVLLSPLAGIRAKAKYEHVEVMEKHLGRTLLPGEVVHHINGIKTDNRLSNLMLFKNHSAHLVYEHKNARTI
jgi:hypothetical protein